MKHKRKKIVVLLIVAIIGISTAYLLRTQKLSNVVSIADEVSIQAFNIGVNQDGDHDLYEINDVTIASQLNELFDDTEVRFAPLRYKIKPYSNDPTWIGWDFLFEDESGHHSIYIRSMDSDYFTISINSSDTRAYRIKDDMDEFRNQVNEIMMKGLE